MALLAMHIPSVWVRQLEVNSCACYVLYSMYVCIADKVTLSFMLDSH